MTHRNGFLLIELIISLAIMAVLIPLLSISLLQTHGYMIQNTTRIHQLNELRHLEQFIRQDIKQAITVNQVGPSGLDCQLSPLIRVTYSISKSQLKRKQYTLGKSRPYTIILAKSHTFNAINTTLEVPTLLSLAITIDKQPHEWQIHLPNVQ